MKYELPKARVMLVKETGIKSENKIECCEDAVKVVSEYLSDFDREAYVIVNLDTKGKPISFNVVSIGTLSYTVVSPREVFKCAILSNAHSVIGIHNHPSGSLEPSGDDIKTAKNLDDCGRMIGIPFLDHLIVADGRYFSFKREDMLNEV